MTAPGKALIVYESMFDNTARVSEAVASGLRRAGLSAHAVPVTSLAAVPGRAAVGVRDWIPGVTPQRFGTDRLAVFDTRVARVRRLPWTANRTAARLLQRRGFRLVRKPAAFLVEETPGPLCRGEEERAELWGQMVGAAYREETEVSLSPSAET